MRRFLILFIILLPAVNYTADACSSCTGRRGAFGAEGFTTGLEFGIEGVNKDNRMPYLTAIAGFGHSFLDGALDVYSELNYTLGFVGQRPVSNQSPGLSIGRCIDCGDDLPHNGGSQVLPYERNRQSLYFNFMIGFNLKLGLDNETVLSFILQNEIDELIISPVHDGNNNVTGILTPAVRFNHEFNTGDIYAQIGVPITYIQETQNADVKTGLEFTLGWNSLFGLELETTLFTQFAPNAGFDALAFMVGYELNEFHFSVDTFIPLINIDGLGVNITPQIEFALGQWTFYVNCVFYHVGAASGLHVTPALGFKFNIGD